MAGVELCHAFVEFPIFDAKSRSLKKRVLTSVGGAIRTGAKVPIVTALRDITLSLAEGDRVGLVGHNGAGKSTLLRLAAGICEPTRGSARRTGRVAPVFDLGLGMDPEISGLENIVVRGMFLGMTRRRMRARIDEIAEFTELGDYLRMPLRTYSTGMRVRLALGVVTSIDPEILLLDEGIGAVDADFLERARARLRDLVARCGLLVFASHTEEFLLDLCDSALWLDSGRIVRAGPATDVVRAYRGSSGRADAEPQQRRAADDPIAADRVLQLVQPRVVAPDRQALGQGRREDLCRADGNRSADRQERPEASGAQGLDIPGGHPAQDDAGGEGDEETDDERAGDVVRVVRADVDAGGSFREGEQGGDGAEPAADQIQGRDGGGGDRGVAAGKGVVVECGAGFDDERVRQGTAGPQFGDAGLDDLGDDEGNQDADGGDEGGGHRGRVRAPGLPPAHDHQHGEDPQSVLGPGFGRSVEPGGVPREVGHRGEPRAVDGRAVEVEPEGGTGSHGRWSFWAVASGGLVLATGGGLLRLHLHGCRFSSS